MYDEKIIEDSLEFCKQIRIYREADQKRKENLSFVEKIGKQYEQEIELRGEQAEKKLRTGISENKAEIEHKWEHIEEKTSDEVTVEQTEETVSEVRYLEQGDKADSRESLPPHGETVAEQIEKRPSDKVMAESVEEKPSDAVVAEQTEKKPSVEVAAEQIEAKAQKEKPETGLQPQAEVFPKKEAPKIEPQAETHTEKEVPEIEPQAKVHTEKEEKEAREKSRPTKMRSARNVSGVNMALLGEEEKPAGPDPSIVKEEIARQGEKRGKRPTSETPMLSFVNNILLVCICVLVGFLAASLITHFCIYETRVEGSSMEPALSDRDHVFIEKIGYHFHNPKRYEIIVFPVTIPEKEKKKETKETSYYVKRIIGMPGETVQIQDGNVYIDGRKLVTDTYRLSEILDPGIAGEEIKLKEDEYFVLGDNRNLSTDSRSEYVGAIKKDDIDGKVVFRIWPFSRMGKVK